MKQEKKEMNIFLITEESGRKSWQPVAWALNALG